MDDARELGPPAATSTTTPFTRLGDGDEVAAVAELWRAGKRDEARAAVPIDLGRLTNLVGTPDAIADRVRRHRDAGITTLLAKLEGDHAQTLETLERLIAIVGGALGSLRWA